MIPDRLAKNTHRALAGAKLAGGQLQQSGFAGTVGAEQTGHASGDFDRQLIDADDIAVPLGDLVEGNDSSYFSRSSDLTGMFSVHADSPNRTINTAADQYHGYRGPWKSNKNRSRPSGGSSLLRLSHEAF